MIKWVNLVSYIAMICVNAIANFGKLGGNTTAGISDLYDSVLTPAGFAFMIWGLIYVLLLFFVITPFVNPKGAAAEFSDSVGIWFSLSCIVNALWMISWHNKMIVLSFVLMLVLFGSLYFAILKVTKTKRTASVNDNAVGSFLSRAGIEVYFGWISVAMLANLMSMFTFLGLDGFGSTASILGGALLLAGSLLVSFICMYSSSMMIAFAAVWAYSCILYRHMAEAMLNWNYVGIIVTAAVGIVFILIGFGFGVSTASMKELAEE